MQSREETTLSVVSCSPGGDDRHPGQLISAHLAGQVIDGPAGLRRWWPTLTGDNDASLTKKIELAGWDYPRHLAGRRFSAVVALGLA